MELIIYIRNIFLQFRMIFIGFKTTQFDRKCWKFTQLIMTFLFRQYLIDSSFFFWFFLMR